MERETWSRRQFLLWGAMAGAATALAACAPKAVEVEKVVTKVVKEVVKETVIVAGTPQVVEKEVTKIVEKVVKELVTTTPAPKGPVTITFSGWGGAEEDEGVRDAVKEFQDAQGEVKVMWIHIPQNYLEKILAMIAAGTPPDTGFVSASYLRDFVCERQLLDLTDRLAADPVIGDPDYFVMPVMKQKCEFKGRWYGLSTALTCPHFFYNADLFEDEGIEPPSNDPDKFWDWDHFLEVCRALTVDDNGKHPGESGFDLDNVDRFAVRWPNNRYNRYVAVAGNGAADIDPETMLCVLDSPEAMEAIQSVADLELVHYVAPSAVQFGELGMSVDQGLENRKLAMYVSGSWAMAWAWQQDFTLGTGVLPAMKKPKVGSQGHVHGMFRGTTDPDAAWKWLSFMHREFYAMRFYKNGLWQAGLTSLATDEGVKKWMTPGIHTPGYELIPTKYLRYNTEYLYIPPGYQRAEQELTPQYDKIWIGDAKTEEVLPEAVAKANAILLEASAKCQV